MKQPICSALIAAFATCLLSVTAHAKPPDGLELSAGASLLARHTTPVDLAALAGARGYGSGSDLGPAVLGFEAHGGLNLPLAELGVGGFIGVGGLALDRIESRYLGGGAANTGSSLDLGVEAALRLHPELSEDVGLRLGPAVAWQRMSAASPLGLARLDLLGVGLDAGLAWRTGAISPKVDGHLELMLSARRELPLGLHVDQGPGQLVLSGTAGGATAYSFGARLGYVFDFHRAR